MAAISAPLFVNNSLPIDAVSVAIFPATSIVAFVNVTVIDSTMPFGLADFDADNAVAADILLVDGVRRTPVRVSGGRWGPLGSGSNVFAGSFTGFGSTVTFFLRRFGPDVVAAAEAIVITDP